MVLREINKTGWFEDVQHRTLGDGFKMKYDKSRIFHLKPTKINGKRYWFKYSYYVTETKEPHIVYTIGGDNSPKYNVIQIEEKHFYYGAPHEVYQIYYKLGNLKKV